MRGGHLERESPGRLPRRPTDRMEDTVAWLLAALGLLAAVLAVTISARVYGDGMLRARVEAAEHTPVQAVVLESTDVTPPRARAVGGAHPVPVLVPIRYTSPDGAEYKTQVRVSGNQTAGAQVQVWVDHDGALTATPTQRPEVILAAAASAATVVGIALLLLAGTWKLVSAVIGRVNAADWEHEWALVEPRWSGGLM